MCASWRGRSFVGIVVAGELIVGLRVVRFDMNIGEIGAASEVDGQCRAAPAQTVTAREDVGNRGGTRRAARACFVDGGPQLSRAVVVEQKQELGGLRSRRLTAREGGIEQSLDLGGGAGEPAVTGTARGLALVFQKRHLVGGVFDPLVTIVASYVARDLSRAVQKAHFGVRGGERQRA